MFKKLINLFAIAFIAITITSCASNAILKEPASITKHEEAMFWEINATDKYGEPSTVYVLGTIHAGTDVLYPLPTVVDEAFINSDVIYGEISSEDNSKIMQETITRQMASMERENIRIKKTGKKLSDFLTKDQIALATALLGSPDVFAQMELFEPWVLNTALTTVPITASGLDPSKGYDMYFTQRSTNEGRPVQGLDTLETQFAIIEYGDWETQLSMLQESLDHILETMDDPGKELKELYSAYLTHNDVYLSEVLAKQLAEDTSAEAEEFNKLVFTDRNKDWAMQFANFLNEGGTTFIFAGCGHFVGDDSVFVHMAENGNLDY